MILKERSQRMLKYEKAKAKLAEFEVNREDYPGFPMNSDDLVYTTLFVMSRYCEELIANPNSSETSQLFTELTSVAQYYDSAVKSKCWEGYDRLFLLLGATAYFMSEDFGSAKVLIERIGGWTAENTLYGLLYYTLCFFLLDKAYPSEICKESHVAFADAITTHFSDGTQIDPAFVALKKMIDESLLSSEIMDITYADILFGVTVCAAKHSAWNLLPRYSTASPEEWRLYLSQRRSIKLLWPAQKLLIEAGILQGRDLVVPFPTGVGKTKSIELIIRSAFLGKEKRIALVLTPLRALCNEVTQDLSAASLMAIINQLSDTAQDDFNFDLLEDEKYILVCTPEKFTYLMRHQTDILQEINLFIFDEAHLFDDSSRGVQYELLVSEIVRNRAKSSQMVLFSAVLSNPGQIAEWIFSDTSAAVDYSLVKSTEKSIGFLSSDQTIHYYRKGNMEEESFFVPKSIQISPLQKIGRERKKRYFPESSARDLAIYYGIKLCGHGGAAIFAGQIRSISAIMKRFIDIVNRGYDLSNLQAAGKRAEIDKLQHLFEIHYGSDSVLTKAAGFGVLPHYAHLPNGVKLSVEYALRKQDVRLVVCTTTLAEGVNIPIKYLLLTTFTNGNSTMQIRKMQNLIGRTARSGIHTEGSALITDAQFYDNRLKRAGGGKYKWNDCIKMFDREHAEPCGSAILQLVSPLKIDYGFSFDGDKVAEYILENYDFLECFSNLEKRMVDSYQKQVSQDRFQNHRNEIAQKVNQLKHTIEDIENYLCYIYHTRNINENYIQIAKTLFESTFAFHLASEKQRECLQNLFVKIANRIQNTVENNSAAYFAKSLYGLQLTKYIFQWTQENSKLLADRITEYQFDLVINLFLQLFPEKIRVTEVIFKDILQLWISGKLYKDIFRELEGKVSISEIERLCTQTISYDFSFFVGNLVDAIGEGWEVETLVLSFYQKQVKYGVPTYFQVMVCENIFDDRYLASILEKVCDSPDSSVSADNLKQLLQSKEATINKALETFPRYFSYKFKQYIKVKV